MALFLINNVPYKKENENIKGKNMKKENMLFDNSFLPHCGVIMAANSFSATYPIINNYIVENIDFSDSRGGRVKELLDVKTILNYPYRRCVGGYNRNINVFFLLVEAIWIVLGRKDVETLVNFNSNMKNYSDDGETFHAPYGFRLRHWGIRTEDKYQDGITTSQGIDQVINAIKLLTENPNTRQVVMSIWNPNFDLGVKTKDIPCNDMVMLKIRDGKLITTIQNRSNDLHWGLPTNIFQFSFLTEIMAKCLGITLGTQTHNSQSLHVYEWNDITNIIYKKYKERGKGYDLYNWASERHMDFNFSHDVPANRFREVEYYLSLIIDNINAIAKGKNDNNEEIKALKSFSIYMYNVYQLLKIYLVSQRAIKSTDDVNKKDDIRVNAINQIEALEENELRNWDVSMLAKNFFAARIQRSEKYKCEYYGKL